jgi:hypothetical protein
MAIASLAEVRRHRPAAAGFVVLVIATALAALVLGGVLGSSGPDGRSVGIRQQAAPTLSHDL